MNRFIPEKIAKILHNLIRYPIMLISYPLQIIAHVCNWISNQLIEFSCKWAEILIKYIKFKKDNYETES